MHGYIRVSCEFLSCNFCKRCIYFEGVEKRINGLLFCRYLNLSNGLKRLTNFCFKVLSVDEALLCTIKALLHSC